MTNEKAIDIFNRYIACHNEVRCYTEIMCKDCEYNVTVQDIDEAMRVGIEALKKLEQTKEVIPHRNYQYLSDYWCECGWHLGKKGDVKFCADCGRRIKWD